MSQESWTVIGTGIALLVALGGLMLTLSAWQRDDTQQLRTEIQQLRAEFHQLRTEFQQLRTDVGAETGKLQQGQSEMRERLARIETTIGIAHPNLSARIGNQTEPNT